MGLEFNDIGHYHMHIFPRYKDDGIPATMFGVADIYEEYRCLLEKGVTFTMEPTEAGGIIMAIFDDTCGNLIQIVQQ